MNSTWLSWDISSNTWLQFRYIYLHNNCLINDYIVQLQFSHTGLAPAMWWWLTRKTSTPALRKMWSTCTTMDQQLSASPNQETTTTTAALASTASLAKSSTSKLSRESRDRPESLFRSRSMWLPRQSLLPALLPRSPHRRHLLTTRPLPSPQPQPPPFRMLEWLLACWLSYFLCSYKCVTTWLYNGAPC